MVATTGLVPVLIAVNAAMLPEPLAAKTDRRCAVGPCVAGTGATEGDRRGQRSITYNLACCRIYIRCGIDLDREALLLFRHRLRNEELLQWLPLPLCHRYSLP